MPFEPLRQECPRCYAPPGTVPVAPPYRAEFADEDTDDHRRVYETTKKRCAACGVAVDYCQLGHPHAAHHPPAAFLDWGPLIYRRLCREFQPPRKCPSCRRSYPLHFFSTAVNFTYIEGEDIHDAPIWKPVGWWQLLTRYEARDGSDYFYHRFGGQLFHKEDTTLDACDYCLAMTVCAVCHRRYELGDNRTRERWQEFIHTGENNRQAQRLVDELGKDPSARRCRQCGGGEALSDENIATLRDLAGKR